MSNARNLARLIVDSGGDVEVSSLGNVPPSNDASALTTGTLGALLLPTYSVLNVAQVSHGTVTSLGSTVDNIYRSYGTAVITPSRSNSKILIFHSTEYEVAGGNYPAIRTRIMRDGGAVHTKGLRGYQGGSGDHFITEAVSILLDSPNTTSAVTYSFEATNDTGSSVSGGYTGRVNGYNSSLTILMEIAG